MRHWQLLSAPVVERGVLPSRSSGSPCGRPAKGLTVLSRSTRYWRDRRCNGRARFSTRRSSPGRASSNAGMDGNEWDGKRDEWVGLPEPERALAPTPTRMARERQSQRMFGGGCRLEPVSESLLRPAEDRHQLDADDGKPDYDPARLCLLAGKQPVKRLNDDVGGEQEEAKREDVLRAGLVFR